MGRMIGTVSMGIRAPIIRAGDDLVQIVTNCILEAMKEDGLTPRDRDIIAITESIVARVQGNYVTVDNIAEDIRAKFGGGEIGVIHPILSRNRFSTCLRGIAKGCKKIYMMLSYPGDEVAVVENFSLRLPLEGWASLSGISGRGKTTFLNLLMGKFSYQGSISASVSFSYFPCWCGKMPSNKLLVYVLTLIFISIVAFIH